jgi:hypothetical protein
MASNALTRYYNAVTATNAVVNAFSRFTTLDSAALDMIQNALSIAQRHHLHEQIDALTRLLMPQRDAGTVLTNGAKRRAAQRTFAGLWS